MSTIYVSHATFHGTDDYESGNHLAMCTLELYSLDGMAAFDAMCRKLSTHGGLSANIIPLEDLVPIHQEHAKLLWEKDLEIARLKVELAAAKQSLNKFYPLKLE